MLAQIANDTGGSRRSLECLSETSTLKEFLSYSYLCGAGSRTNARLIEIPEDRLRSLISIVLDLVDVDEQWYLEANPDVAAAITSNRIASARSHYIVSGFYENRFPHEIIVDDTWYQLEYPDVQTAILRGGVETCQDHFNRYGFLEGRLPSKGWSLLSHRPTRTHVQQA